MGKLKFSKVDICIDSLINQTILELKPLTVNKQIVLNQILEHQEQFFSDPDRIEQVLTNLIKNSIDFVNVKDGKITVRVEKTEDSKVIFTIEDNGIRIKPEKADKLFQKFYQIDIGAARKHGGTGRDGSTGWQYAGVK